MKRYLILLSLIASLAIFQIPTAFACSGGGAPPEDLEDMLSNDVLVRATVIENSGGNSILQVEHYLKGSGSKNILVYRQSPATYKSKRVRGYDYGCAYAIPALADVGTRAYFALSHQPNGTYTLGYWEYYAIVPIVDDENAHYVSYAVYTGEPENKEVNYTDYEYLQVSEAEFEATVAEMLGHSGSLPDAESDYPRYRTLMITTESGQRYMMPIDSYELVLMEGNNTSCEENCSIVSPDGTHFATPLGDDRYGVWYSRASRGDEDWCAGWQNGEMYVNPPCITAQELLFSPDGDFILAWNEAELSIYGFNIWEDYGYYGQLPTLAPIWRGSLATNEELSADILAGKAAWSGNSYTIAYWDADGLKWLDLNTMVVPRLLVEHSKQFAEFPALLELSSTGRYVRFGTEQEWSLVDTVSGLVFDDTLISPNETSFLQISPEEYISNTLDSAVTETVTNCVMYDNENESCFMFSTPSFDGCNVPMGSCAEYVPVPEGYELVATFWQSENNLIVIACAVADESLCYAYNYWLDYRYSQHRITDYLTPYDTNAYVFDSSYGKLAWAVDDYSLRLMTSAYEVDEFEFSGTLDSPIASLEWGAPLWYVDG